MILSCCQIHRGCTIEVFFGEEAGGRIPWPDPDLKPDAERDFPGLVPNHLKHVLKDPNVKAREAIGALTAEVADLREENKKLLDQLAAAGFRNDAHAACIRQAASRRWLAVGASSSVALGVYRRGKCPPDGHRTGRAR